MGAQNEQEITAFDEAEADSRSLNSSGPLPLAVKNLFEQKMSKHFKAPMCHFPLATMELLSPYTGAKQTLAKVCALFFLHHSCLLPPPQPFLSLPLPPYRRQPLTMSWESY